MTFLLALPNWIKVAILSGILIGSLEVKHFFQVRGLEKQIAACTLELKNEQLDNAQLLNSVKDMQIKARDQAMKSAADARKILTLGKELSTKLKNGSTVAPGAAEMNKWIKEIFEAK